MKKGFTLIELLAVILILGIIALIAIPTINSVINESKQGAFKSTVQNVASDIERVCQVQQLNGSDIENVYTFSEDGVYPSIDMKGNLPTSGEIKIDDDCNITSVTVSNGSYTASIEDGKIVTDEIESNLAYGLNIGTAVYMNPETKKICSESDAVSTTGTKTGCMKWYVYNVNGDGTYQLILDHNTTSSLIWVSQADYVSAGGTTTDYGELGNNDLGALTVLAQLASDTATWDSSLEADIITAEEVAKIVGADLNSTLKWKLDKETQWQPGLEVLNDTQNAYFYFDGSGADYTVWQTKTATSIGASSYAWLYDNTYGCTNNGCNVEDNNSYNDSNIYGYWTKDGVVSIATNAWYVSSNGALNRTNIDFDIYYGLRPVITF